MQVQTGVTVTLNADLRVGGLQETITVTGETPVVDVQNSTRVQTVLSDEVAGGAAGVPRLRESADGRPRAFRPTARRAVASTRG